MRKVLGLIVLLIVAAIGWIGWQRYAHRPAEVSTDEIASAEIADRADDKLQQLKNGDAETIGLSGIELESLLKFRFVQLLPAFVESPRILVQNDKINVQTRIPVENLPSLSELGEAAAFLPDTTEVNVTGGILPLDSGRVAIQIEDVRAARIPLPSRMIPRALARLGRSNEPGLPKDALALPLPGGATSAYVRGDSLFLSMLSNRQVNRANGSN